MYRLEDRIAFLSLLFMRGPKAAPSGIMAVGDEGLSMESRSPKKGIIRRILFPWMIIAVLMLGLGAGGYFLIEYRNLTDHLARSERFSDKEDYTGASNSLKSAGRSWLVKLIGIKVSNIKVLSTEIKTRSEDQLIYQEGMEIGNKGDWEEGITRLSGVPSDSFYHLRGQIGIEQFKIAMLGQELEMEQTNRQTAEKEVERHLLTINWTQNALEKESGEKMKERLAKEKSQREATSQEQRADREEAAKRQAQADATSQKQRGDNEEAAKRQAQADAAENSTKEQKAPSVSKEQAAAKNKSVAQEQKVAEQVEATKANAEQSEQEEPKQRRNRRSPRHLRASGQRRRRGRDRRPNPFRLRKGGVASPEMAMGKVMPRFIPKPHHKQAKPEVAEVAVETQTVVNTQEQNVAQETAPQSSVVMAGGFACPELAMGKVIIRREETAVTQVPVAEAKVTEAPAVVEEAPVVVEAKVEAPVVETPVVEAPVESVKAEETVAEAPAVEAEAAVVEPAKVVEAPKVEEAPVVKAQMPKTTVAKKQAGSPMTKAPGPQEIKEIEVVAAPFRTERFVPKGAGSQVASNKAGAGMTKPNY